jgi:drug/metabolite transporter (DMT)-like permease
MTVELGILIAIACAVFSNLAFLYKHRGACAAPDVNWRHPLKSGANLFRSKWFAIGMAIALFAWLLHVAALALAPLSLVQAVLAGGLVFLTVLAERVFGFKVGLRQWAGVALMAVGLMLLVIVLPVAILPKSGGAHSTYSNAGMIAFEMGLLALGTLLVLSPKLGTPRHHHGIVLGLASGLLFGVSDVAIKALTGLLATDGVFGVLTSPWLLTCVAASVLAFFASARGLQTGEAVPVITMTSAGANISCIAGGIIVFGDPMPNDTLGIVLQSVAFLMVIVAAALTPAPMRAANAQTA